MLRPRRSLPLVAALLFVAVTGTHANTLSERIDRYLRAYAERGDLSGCVLIGRGNEIVFEAAYGRADFAHDVPHSPLSRFQIGSVSKQFTAAAILMLAERGKIDLQAPIARWLPEYPRGDVITPHQLLTHTAGIRSLFSIGAYPELKTRYLELSELVAVFANEPLDFEPGSRHQYSGSGYILLAHLIEVTSGMPFDEFLRENLFEPLGMSATAHREWGPVYAHLSTGYDPAGARGVEHPPFVHPSTTTGAASLIASARDMWRWNQALQRGELLDEESIRLLQTPVSGSYAYGLASYEADGRRVVAHDGRVPGFTSDVSRYPDDDVTIIVLSNVQSGIGDSMRRDLRSIVFDGAAIEPSDPGFRRTALPLEELSGYPGRYEFGPGFVVTAELRGRRLFVAANAGEFSELVPEKDGTFFSRMLYARVRFERDTQGAVQRMLWIQDGNEFPGPRMSDR